MKNVCIFCGSSVGDDPAFLEAARLVGPALAKLKLGMVYGGASVGLMGATADAALAAGVYVVGVQPQFLEERELSHQGLQELLIVETMHIRKQTMADRSDGFLTLPGGIGTLEELCEIFTWAQLGLHTKPIGLLNTKGYYNGLISWFDTMVAHGFMRQEFRQMLLVGEDVERLLLQMEAYQAPAIVRWTKQGVNNLTPPTDNLVGLG